MKRKYRALLGVLLVTVLMGAAANNTQVQQYVNERVRVRAEEWRHLDLAMADDKLAINDVYDACEPTNEATWADNRTDGPPRLLAPGDVLSYNAIISIWPKIKDGTATDQEVDNFAANWPVFMSACVRPVNP